MASRFRPGAAAYAKDGTRYVVEAVDGGLVYCSASGGAEMEFPEAQLLTEAEWAGRSGGRRDMVYARLKRAPEYAQYRGKIDRDASERLLAKADSLRPGILDFTAFTIAGRIAAEGGSADIVSELSIVKCREIFDAAPPESRAAALAALIGTPAETLLGAVRLGDNLMRAMLDKGLDARLASFEAFSARPRR